MRRLKSLLIVIAFAVVAVACGSTDTGITTNIKTKFAADDMVKAHEINVTTRDHVVTLSGRVETPVAKAQALRIAREADGVIDVVDQIQVAEATAATTGIGDRDIDRDVAETENVFEKAADATVDAAKKGAEVTADAATKVGTTVRDAVTDDDRDSDNDGN